MRRKLWPDQLAVAKRRGNRWRSSLNLNFFFLHRIVILNVAMAPALDTSVHWYDDKRYKPEKLITPDLIWRNHVLIAENSSFRAPTRNPETANTVNGPDDGIHCYKWHP